MLDSSMLRSAFERVQQKLNVHNQNEGIDPSELFAKILRERMQQQGVGRQSNVEVEEINEDFDGPDD